MKNITVLIFSMVLASNTFAYTLKHKHENNLTYLSKAKHTDVLEDFSGIWIGNCDNEQFKLSITQDDKHITLVYSEKERPDFDYTFELNKLVTHVSSSSSINESNILSASIKGNFLRLMSHGIITGDYTEGLYIMDALMIKEDDTITIINSPEESCILHKSH